MGQTWAALWNVCGGPGCQCPRTKLALSSRESPVSGVIGGCVGVSFLATAWCVSLSVVVRLHSPSTSLHVCLELLFCFDYMNVCICVQVCVCVSEGALGDQKRVPDSLELELQVTVNCPSWVLGTDLRLSIRTTHTLDC